MASTEGDTTAGFNEGCLFDAAENGHIEMVKWIFANDVTADDMYGTTCTALKYAARGGHLDIVQWLTTNGGVWGEPLVEVMIDAASEGHLDVVQWLVENGSVEHFNDAMVAAASEGHLEIVQYLTANGATNIEWAVLSAAAYGSLDVVKWLAANGASRYLDDAVEAAASEGHLEVVKWLAVNGAADLDGAKFNAGREGHSEIVRFINVFRGLQAFKKAVRAWLVINYWIKQVGMSQYAPDSVGGKRYIAELEHVGKQVPELTVIEAFGELGVLSSTKGKRPRLAKRHTPAPQTFDCGECGSRVIDCVDCDALVCTGCDEDFGCDA